MASDYNFLVHKEQGHSLSNLQGMIYTKNWNIQN
jgi:hypothetical protein